jgi:hypothetical protein
MKKSFKEFYSADDKQSSEKHQIKWDVILFIGNYNPICRDELHRIHDYMENYVLLNKEKFNDSADIGLLTSSSSINDINIEMKCELSFEERQYISGKLFGLKMFPIDFDDLIGLSHIDENELLQEKIDDLCIFFKQQFNNSNILIVMQPSDESVISDLNKISHVFLDNGVNIGFMSYKHTSLKNDEYFSNIPDVGAMIKACCLLDAERPDALSLKNFTYRYNLQDYLEKIKTMHFITRNEKYNLVFKYLFPDVKLHERSNDEQETNLHTVMELIKSMYLSKKQ